MFHKAAQWFCSHTVTWYLSLLKPNGIHNRSSYQFSFHETLFLSKGLKFIPTPRTTPIQIINHVLTHDWKVFERRLQLQYIDHLQQTNEIYINSIGIPDPKNPTITCIDDIHKLTQQQAHTITQRCNKLKSRHTTSRALEWFMQQHPITNP
ncbi:MAG: hypothetical protein Q7V20_21880, partial [Aquabacterium sp.]|uniref:hypothetical protein n=1 Tax=Aquabacterium sp. TaxID=1872578 RepID=UPI002718F49F